MIDPRRKLPAHRRIQLAIILILMVLALAILGFGLRATVAAGCFGPC